MAPIAVLLVLPTYELIGVAKTGAWKPHRKLAKSVAFSNAATLTRDPAVDLVTGTGKLPHHLPLVDAALGWYEWPLGRTLQEAEDIAAWAQALGVHRVADAYSTGYSLCS
jgi:predicted dehydrogenase